VVKEELLLLLVQVLLHSEKPSLNAYWWFGFRAINQFKWLMVSVEGKFFTYKIQMERSQPHTTARASFSVCE
jgi:hypothetical protein